MDITIVQALLLFICFETKAQNEHSAILLSTNLLINDTSSGKNFTMPITTLGPLTVKPLVAPAVTSTTTQNPISVLEPYEERDTILIIPDNNLNKSTDSDSRVDYGRNLTADEDQSANKTNDLYKDVIIFNPINDKITVRLENITNNENNYTVLNEFSENNFTDVLTSLEKYFDENNDSISQMMDSTTEISVSTTQRSTTPYVKTKQIVPKIKPIESPTFINKTSEKSLGKEEEKSPILEDRDVLIFSPNNATKTSHVKKSSPSASQTNSDLFVAIRSAVTELSPRSLMTQEQSTDGESASQEQTCVGNCAQASSSSVNGVTKTLVSVKKAEPSWGKKRGPALKCGRKGTKGSSEPVLLQPIKSAPLQTINLQKLQRSREERAISSATATATAFSGFPGWDSGPAIANAEGKAISQGGGNSIANGQARAFSQGPGPSIANSQGNALSGGPGSGNAIGQSLAISNGPGITISNGQGSTFSDGSGQSIANGQGNTFSTGNGIGLAQGAGNAFGGGPGVNNANGQGTAFSLGPGLSMSNGQGLTYVGNDGNGVAEGKGTVFNMGNAIGDGRGNAMAGDPNTYDPNMQGGYAPYAAPSSYDSYGGPGMPASGVPTGYDQYSSPSNQPYAYDPYPVPTGGSSSSLPSGYNPYSMPVAQNSVPTSYEPYGYSPSGYPAYNNPLPSQSVPSGYENYAAPSNTYTNPYSYGSPSSTSNYNSPYQSFGLKKRDVSYATNSNSLLATRGKSKAKTHAIFKRNVYNNNIYSGRGFNPSDYISYGLANAAAASNSYGMSNLYEAPDLSDLYGGLNEEFQDEGEAASELYGISVKPSQSNSYAVPDVEIASVNKEPTYSYYSPSKSDVSNINSNANLYNMPSYAAPSVSTYQEADDEVASPTNPYGASDSQSSSNNGYQIQSAPSYGSQSSPSYNKPVPEPTYGSYDKTQSNKQEYTTTASKPISSYSSPTSNSYQISEDTASKNDYTTQKSVNNYGTQTSGISSSNGYSSSAGPFYEPPEKSPAPTSYGASSSETISSPSYGTASQDQYQTSSNKEVTGYAPSNSYGGSNNEMSHNEDYVVPTTMYESSYGSESANGASNPNAYNVQADSSLSSPVAYESSVSSASSSNSYGTNTKETTTVTKDTSYQEYNSQTTEQSKGSFYGTASAPAYGGSSSDYYKTTTAPEVVYTSHDAETVTQATYSSPNLYGLPSENTQVSSESNSDKQSGYSNPSSSYGMASESSSSGNSYSQSNDQTHQKESLPSYASEQHEQAKEPSSNAALYGVQSEEAAPSTDESSYKTIQSHSSSTASASADSTTTVNIYGGGESASASTGHSSAASSSSSSISQTADTKEYCWQAAVILKGKYKCGGSLIRRQWVLTAAHCVEGAKSSDIQIQLGKNELTNGGSSNGQLISAESIKIHSYYNSVFGMYDHDVALIKLASPALFSDRVCLICLPGKPAEFFNGKQCTVTGYGSDSLGGSPLKRLKEISVPIVPSKNCERVLKNSIPDFHMHESFMCAGGEHMKDTCSGDGGSPLVCEAGDDIFVQVGLVAWGVGCGQAGVPAVYSNVYYFDQWIEETIQ